MKKKELVTYILLGIGGLLVVLSAALLVLSIRQYREREQQFRGLRTQLMRLYASDVFPSAKNMEIERENRRQLEEWYQDLMLQLGRGNVLRDDRSPSQFIGRLDRTRNDLRQQAERNRVRLPDGSAVFAFGFERYAGTGQLPSPDDVPRLTEQLIIITRLTRLMIDSDISAVRSIQRDIFEERAAGATAQDPVPGVRGAAQPSPARRGASPDSRRAVAARGPAPDSRQQQARMFTTERIVLEFNAREESLARLLNALASNPMYTVVRAVRLQKDVPDMVPVRPAAGPGVSADRRPETETDLSFLFGGGGVATAPAPAVAERPAGAVLGPSHPVSGIEMEIPMQVRLEIDVYKFRSADENRD
ncbi:MAG: hypothetical protein ACNA71_05400 [Kiritimatiellia bacterium]